MENVEHLCEKNVSFTKSKKIRDQLTLNKINDKSLQI